MNDTDYIRKAVELADGIEFGDAEDELIIAGEKITSRYGLDILAAQLVRQVLAAGHDITIEVQGSHFEAPGVWVSIHDPVKSEAHRREFDGRDNLDNNTIKAIVDSEVLS